MVIVNILFCLVFLIYLNYKTVTAQCGIYDITQTHCLCITYNEDHNYSIDMNCVRCNITKTITNIDCWEGQTTSKVISVESYIIDKIEPDCYHIGSEKLEDLFIKNIDLTLDKFCIGSNYIFNPDIYKSFRNLAKQEITKIGKIYDTYSQAITNNLNFKYILAILETRRQFEKMKQSNLLSSNMFGYDCKYPSQDDEYFEYFYSNCYHTYKGIYFSTEDLSQRDIKCKAILY